MQGSVKTMPSRSQPRSAGPRTRHGAAAVLGVLLLVLFVLLTVLVVTWTYLSTAHQRLQNMCSIMALAAAPELLDQNLLIDAFGPPLPNQAAGRQAAVVAAQAFRGRNNAIVTEVEQVDAADVIVQTGYINDVTNALCALDPQPLEHNTVFVGGLQTSTGGHPVRWPMDSLNKTPGVQIRGGAFATLDNLVIGFRPEPELAAPVMPLAIDAAAWASQRTTDSNGNGIREMVLLLQAGSPSDDPSSSPASANAALLAYGGNGDSQAIARLGVQVARGLLPADLLLGQVGPATVAAPWPVLALQPADASDASTAALLSALQAAVGQKRVFPIFQQLTQQNDGTTTAQIEGFVACVLLGAWLADNRLAIAVEPCFLIHHTAWTAPPNPLDPANPPRNLYIYKLRLSR